MSSARVVLIDNEDGRLVADFIDEDFIVFHVRAIRFARKSFDRYVGVFDSILANLRKLGYKAVYAAPFANNAWAVSLCRTFGFTEHHRVRDLVVMRREI